MSFGPLTLIQNPNISSFQHHGKWAEWVFSPQVITKPFAFEIFDCWWWAEFVGSRWSWSIYIGIGYLLTIFSLQRFMQNRPGYELKGTLAIWNGLLGLFSIAGFLRSLPALVYILGFENGFYRSICKRDLGDMSQAYWSLLFILSKFVELGDTVFIVLRKRPLIFLQWYHHLITMIVTWITGPFVEPITRYYTIMNYGVHSLMYPYFSLKALDVHIPRWVSNVITTLQLSQMIMGLFVNFYTMYLMSVGVDCYRHPLSVKVFVLVYGSFTVLFGKLFMDVVNRGKKTKRD